MCFQKLVHYDVCKFITWTKWIQIKGSNGKVTVSCDSCLDGHAFKCLDHVYISADRKFEFSCGKRFRSICCDPAGKKLNVGAEEFFSQLMVSVLYDIKRATGKEVAETKVHQGYKYKKQMKNKLGKQGDVEVEITEWKRPFVYSAKFKSVTGTNRIRYEIESLGEEEIRVNYSEGYDGDTKSQDLNYKIIGAFYKRKAKKRTRQMLHAMENYICQNRKQS